MSRCAIRFQPWIAEIYQELATLSDLSKRYSYQQGNANNIPFEDNTFDMVTCQTLLIHVGDVDHVLSEMIRVLKPGGLLVTVEPNNIARSLCLSTFKRMV
ncbi:class I SAM-dependent methyltransferase [Legionella sp.]|uniref:class I SAM-dependent methyltransferase n=1 Tax=Legionella sp. TaxID=459 RepID=UPI003CB05339